LRQKGRLAAGDGSRATEGGGVMAAWPAVSGSEVAHVGDGKAPAHGPARPPFAPPSPRRATTYKARGGTVEGVHADAAWP